jgi:hypothetical protein
MEESCNHNYRYLILLVGDTPKYYSADTVYVFLIAITAMLPLNHRFIGAFTKCVFTGVFIQ